MDKEHKSKPSIDIDATLRAKREGKLAALEDRAGIVWVREDGAICVGDECIVIKPEAGTKNLDIEIKPTACGEHTADAIVGTLLKTIGKGGNTRFTVKSELTDETVK